jgi:hypothetical protein
VIPTPIAHASQLGNVIFVDDDGLGVVVANIFRDSHRAIRQPPPIAGALTPGTILETTVAGIRVVSTAGFHVDALQKDDTEGYVSANTLFTKTNEYRRVVGQISSQDTNIRNTTRLHYQTKGRI